MRYNGTMNIHPLLVHFPIALLTIYVLLELIRPSRLLASREWRVLKTTLLILGTLGAWAAAATGDFGKSLYPLMREVIAEHEMFGETTTAVFSLLSLIYIFDLLQSWCGERMLATFGRFWTFLKRAREILFPGAVIVIIAIIGFVLLLITGALGGTIVYGPHSDFFVTFVNKVLFQR